MVEAIAREAHLREAQLHRWKGHEIQTLYLGGGTPSLLSEEAITRLIQGVSKALHFDPASLKEVTLEATLKTSLLPNSTLGSAPECNASALAFSRFTTTHWRG